MRLIILFFSILLTSSPGLALTFSKSPAHYASEMEIFYQKPRPEIIVPMLKEFSRSRVLENAEKRMFVAGFLAALQKNGVLDIYNLVNSLQPLAPDTAATLAWAARLNGADSQHLQKLLGTGQPLLLKHMLQTPPNLIKWNPAWENSVVDMYWGAYMATGEKNWLKGIVNSALEFAAKGHGAALRHAAATLYDYAPAHAAIQEYLQTRLKNATLNERRMLETILEHCKEK